MEKMRTEAVNLRMKIQELRDEGRDRQRLYDGAVAENQAALEERDSTIADLRSLLDRRRRELNELEQSIANNHEPDSSYIPLRCPLPSLQSEKS